VAQVEGHIDRIEQMIRSLEIAQLNVEVTERLRQGNEALKSINEVFRMEFVAINPCNFSVNINRRGGAHPGRDPGGRGFPRGT
jgi:hypothetical protein